MGTGPGPDWTKDDVKVIVGEAEVSVTVQGVTTLISRKDGSVVSKHEPDNDTV